MPRERVHHGQILKVTTLGTAPPGDLDGTMSAQGVEHQEQPSLDVSWNRDAGWVQVSIHAPRDFWERLYKDRDPDEQSFAAFTDALSRHEINHLIATLRRARDAAYGKDE